MTLRSYEVRTYGCQMNVHDSERLSGLLEEAGYVARAPRATTPTSSSSTPARSGRTPTTGSTATSATCAGEERRTRACRSPSAAASRRRTAARSSGGRRGSTSSSARTTSGRCRRCSSGPGTTTRRRSRSWSPSRSSRRRCRPGASRPYAAWVSISVGCNNTCTFCIVPSLRGTEKDRRPGEVLAEVEALVGRGRARGHPARAERQLLRRRVRRPAGVRQAAARLRRDRRAWSGSGSPARTPRTSPTTSSPRWPRRRTSCTQLHMPLQSGLRRGAQGACAAPTARSATSASSTGSVPRCRTPRSPPTSSSASPARPTPTSSRRWRSCAGPGSPAPSPSSTPSGPARRPPSWPASCRRPSSRSGTSGWSRCRTRSRWAENQRLVGRVARRAGRRGRGPQGRRDPPAVRPGPRRPARALRACRRTP